MTDREPQYQDEVKSKINEMSGTVIAKYVSNGVTYLDIRTGDDRVYWSTPMSNWEVIRTEEENFE